MNNSGPPFLRVPGFGDLPINHELDHAECFNDGATGWRQIPRLTARELAMITLIDFITDTDKWEVDVFDEQKVAGLWQKAHAAAPMIIFDEKLVGSWGEKEVAVMPLISDKAWNWCISELRDKAAVFKKTGFVRGVDAGSCICKSDVLISTALAEELKHAVIPLREQFRIQNGHDEQIADLVDPSMFPLIYGKTRVYIDGRQVRRENCVESCNDTATTIAPSHPEDRLSPHEVHANLDLYRYAFMFPEHSKSFRWSLCFQWLPCELKFTPGSGTGVSITSYINNLHPVYHKPLYGIIERIMVPTIELWNDCVFKGNKGPAPIRIRTYGYEEGQPPKWLDEIFSTMRSFWRDGNPRNRHNFKDYNHFLVQIDNFLDLPDNSTDDGRISIPELLKQRIANRDRDMGWNYDGCMKLCSLVLEKADCMYAAVHPEPGTAFSY